VRVEQEVSEAVREVQVPLSVGQRFRSFFRRHEECPLRRDVLAQRAEARQHVLVTAEIGGEHTHERLVLRARQGRRPARFDAFVRAVSEPAAAEELPPRGRPVDPERFAAEAARCGIELLGPPGALPE
jgi:hypothetical protein